MEFALPYTPVSWSPSRTNLALVLDGEVGYGATLWRPSALRSPGSRDPRGDVRTGRGTPSGQCPGTPFPDMVELRTGVHHPRPYHPSFRTPDRRPSPLVTDRGGRQIHQGVQAV